MGRAKLTPLLCKIDIKLSKPFTHLKIGKKLSLTDFRIVSKYRSNHKDFSKIFSKKWRVVSN